MLLKSNDDSSTEPSSQFEAKLDFPKRFNIYFWEGINYLGEKYSGYLLARSKSKLKTILVKNEIIIKKIVRQNTILGLFIGNRVSKQDLAVFSRQISVTLNSGLSIGNALKLVVTYQNNKIFQCMLHMIIADLDAGKKLSSSLRNFPEIFNKFYCGMVEIAELNSSAPEIFIKLASYLHKIESFKKKLQKILLYPLLLLLMTVMVLCAIITLVVPQFKMLYSGLGASLPYATKILVSISSFLSNNWLAILCSIFIITGFLYILYNNSQKFLKIADKLVLDIPFWGKFIYKIIIAKWLNILYTTYTSGTPLLNCLGHSKLISKNYAYHAFINTLIVRIANGESFQSALNKTNFLPNSVINILSLGDEASNLDGMLTYLINFYDAEIEHEFEMASAFMEPCIMIFLGLMVGVLVFAIYYPIIKIGALV